MRLRIFVSYARPNHDVVSSLVRLLKSTGVDVWFDKASLLGGQDWGQVHKSAAHKGGSSSSDYSYRSRYGSYVRTVTATKDIEVTITQPRKEKQPLKLEFFFVLKGDSKRYAKQAGVLDLPEGEGSAVFSTSAKQGQQRFVFMGFRESSGERIEGWFVRALNNDRITGITASSPSLEELAAYPEKLKGLLTADWTLFHLAFPRAFQ